MKSTRLSSQYTISRKGSASSSEGVLKAKISAVFLCVDKAEPEMMAQFRDGGAIRGMMAPFEKGKTYYAEYLENYYPNCPVPWARHAWYMHHEDTAFPYVVTAEEIKTFFKRFA